MAKRKHSATQPYFAKLLAAVATIPLTPGVQHVTIVHDDDCPRLQDGDCTCDAEIVMGERLSAKEQT
jgi:hypothetical protein